MNSRLTITITLFFVILFTSVPTVSAQQATESVIQADEWAVPGAPDPTKKGRYMTLTKAENCPACNVYKQLPAGSVELPAGALANRMGLNSTGKGRGNLVIFTATATASKTPDGKLLLHGCVAKDGTDVFNELLVPPTTQTVVLPPNAPNVSFSPNIQVDTTAIAAAIAASKPEAPLPQRMCAAPLDFIPLAQAALTPGWQVNGVTGVCLPPSEEIEEAVSWCKVGWVKGAIYGGGAGAGGGLLAATLSHGSKGWSAGVGGGAGLLIGALTKNRCYGMIAGGAGGTITAIVTRELPPPGGDGLLFKDPRDGTTGTPARTGRPANVGPPSGVSTTLATSQTPGATGPPLVRRSVTVSSGPPLVGGRP